MTPQAQLWTILQRVLKEWAGMSLFIFYATTLLK